jgi:hypothetical protein
MLIVVSVLYKAVFLLIKQFTDFKIAYLKTLYLIVKVFKFTCQFPESRMSTLRGISACLISAVYCLIV